jgi:hypothetical protein
MPTCLLEGSRARQALSLISVQNEASFLAKVPALPIAQFISRYSFAESSNNVIFDDLREGIR